MSEGHRHDIIVKRNNIAAGGAKENPIAASANQTIERGTKGKVDSPWMAPTADKVFYEFHAIGTAAIGNDRPRIRSRLEPPLGAVAVVENLDGRARSGVRCQ
jgi:hypothetical protein